MNIIYNEREFPVIQINTRKDYTDYLCNSASGIKMRFRRWLDGMVEFKGADRVAMPKTFDCETCEDEGFIMSDADDGEGHIMAGAGYPEKCICQFE